MPKPRKRISFDTQIDATLVGDILRATLTNPESEIGLKFRGMFDNDEWVRVTVERIRGGK